MAAVGPLDLSGSVAVVTGAGAGLGRAEALALAAAGADLVVNDMAATDVVDEIEAAGGKAVFVEGDIGERATADALVATAIEHFGGLHVVVNNAGITRDRMLFNMTDEEWDAVIRVHLRGHFLLARNAAAYWREQFKSTGAPVFARLINTSSEAGLTGSEGQPNYAAAKAGIAALTVSTARGCARYGVRANAICPRARTAMTAGLMGEAPGDGPDPLAPEYVAPLVTYLCGPRADQVNGEVFVVHGGVAAMLNPPSVRQVFRADTADGMWTLDAVERAVGAFATSGATPGFACEDTLALADETIGFGS